MCYLIELLLTVTLQRFHSKRYSKKGKLCPLLQHKHILLLFSHVIMQIINANWYKPGPKLHVIYLLSIGIHLFSRHTLYLCCMANIKSNTKMILAALSLITALLARNYFGSPFKKIAICKNKLYLIFKCREKDKLKFNF